MLPCCPHASACDRHRAGRAAPPPRAPGAPPGRPTTCAEVRQQVLQLAQSLLALLVDAHLQGEAVGRHRAQRVARRHHLGSGGRQQAGDLAGGHAGGLLDQLALALRVQQRGGGHRAGRPFRAGTQFRLRITPGRLRCERSGRPPLRRGDRQRYGRRATRRRRKWRSRALVRGGRGGTGSAGGPESARRLRSTPAAPAAHRHAGRRGAAQRRGSPPAPPACLPPPHRRARSAVHAPAPLAVARAGRRYSSPACPAHPPASRPVQRPRWRHSSAIGPPAANPRRCRAGIDCRRLVRGWSATVAAGTPVFVASDVTRRPCLLVDGDHAVRRGCSHRRGTGHPRSRSRLIGIPVTRCARRSRQPKQIVAALLTDVRARSPALALGGGKGGLNLCRRGQTQLAAVRHGPHPAMAPAQPHGPDTALRGGIGEAQLPHRVVEQAREPARQRQVATVDLVEMVQDVHFEATLIGREALGPIEELLITERAVGVAHPASQPLRYLRRTDLLGGPVGPVDNRGRSPIGCRYRRRARSSPAPRQRGLGTNKQPAVRSAS